MEKITLSLLGFRVKMSSLFEWTVEKANVAVFGHMPPAKWGMGTWIGHVHPPGHPYPSAPLVSATPPAEVASTAAASASLSSGCLGLRVLGWRVLGWRIGNRHRVGPLCLRHLASGSGTLASSGVLLPDPRHGGLDQAPFGACRQLEVALPPPAGTPAPLPPSRRDGRP